MNREVRRRLPRRHPRAGRGQSITELALIAPLLCAILLGIVELSGAYGSKMDLQAATAQGARIGALEGNNANVDQAIVNAVVSTRGVNPAGIRQIQIYKAAADGSIDANKVNTYVPPFTSTSLISTTYTWPPSSRHSGEPSDSIGVHVSYRYYPITPLFGHVIIGMDDQTVQRLNPTKTDVPCPIPGIPTDVSAAVNGTQPPANPQDVISWNDVPQADGYAIYANVDGTGFGTTPVYSGTLPSSGGRVQYVYDRSGLGNPTQFAPTTYEVTAYNYCGEGERSLAVSNNQCALPSAPVAVTATAAMTPDEDQVSWLGSWSGTPDPGAYYTITQTLISSGAVHAITATAALTATVMSNPGRAQASYTVGASSGCGVSSPASAPPATTGCPAPALPTGLQVITSTATTTDTVKWNPDANAVAWQVSQTMTGTVTATQVVTQTSMTPPVSATFTLSNKHQPASYTVQGLSSCGGYGPTSASVPNGRT